MERCIISPKFQRGEYLFTLHYNEIVSVYITDMEIKSHYVPVFSNTKMWGADDAPIEIYYRDSRNNSKIGNDYWIEEEKLFRTKEELVEKLLKNNKL